eukprot:SAG31_NODE_1054_length_10140_cov_4.264316_2_plen_174_part_00
MQMADTVAAVGTFARAAAFSLSASEPVSNVLAKGGQASAQSLVPPCHRKELGIKAAMLIPPLGGSTAASSSATHPNDVQPTAPRPKSLPGNDYSSTRICDGIWEHKGAAAVGLVQSVQCKSVKWSGFTAFISAPQVEGVYSWLQTNPLGLMSERESSTISRGLPMFRALFRRL